jgi:hypothetical protein
MEPPQLSRWHPQGERIVSVRVEMRRIVTIRTRVLNQCLVIEVEDNGRDARDPEKIFGPIHKYVMAV